MTAGRCCICAGAIVQDDRLICIPCIEKHCTCKREVMGPYRVHTEGCRIQSALIWVIAQKQGGDT